MELLIRLIKDGNVVGWERSSTTHQLKGLSWVQSRDNKTWYIPTSYTRIVHDRADLYIGITLSDGTKVFENDEVEYGYKGYDPDRAVIKYHADGDYPAFDFEPHAGCDSNGIGHYVCAPDAYIKVTGIHGVNDNKQ